jgi:hypothetical protein
LIEDANNRVVIFIAVLTSQRNLNDSTFCRIRRGVSNYVLDGAAQQLFIAIDDAILTRDQPHGAAGAMSFEVSVGDDLIHQALKVDGGGILLWWLAVQTSKGEKLTDEIVQPIGFALNAVERPSSFRAITFPGQFQRYFQARQRRAQLVRYVVQQSLL